MADGADAALHSKLRGERTEVQRRPLPKLPA
jgi:hypothetical protein